MDNLMILKLNYVKLKGSFENFPVQLRWLCMQGSPLKSIRLGMPMENLVALDMSYSKIESFDMSSNNLHPRANTKRQKVLTGSSSKDKRLLGSLKILDLSICEQLQYVGGFSELPALERLIVRSCKSLMEVCESVEQCVELVHVDLNSCYKLKKVPRSIEKLKKLEELLLGGIKSRESEIETITCKFTFFEFSLPRSLIRLSLTCNNLSTESFPKDFSHLSMLEELRLDGNPIVSMPDCVRTLPKLKKLGMNCCKRLTSIEHPPCTLRELSICSFVGNFKTAPRKIKFDPEMSPLSISGYQEVLGSSCEIDGILKIQPIIDVEENVLQSLGWINLDFNKDMCLCDYEDKLHKSRISIQTQMCYQFGIFSTFYEGKEMPKWITFRSNGGSMSFIIPSSPNKLKGLNVCCCIVPELIWIYSCMNSFYLPRIKVSNITKNYTWTYIHRFRRVEVDGKCLVCLSHWMFGANEMKGGDHIEVEYNPSYWQVIRECGIGLVYEDGNYMQDNDNDNALGYYKSWNHIIGGDLSAFQLTTGEYFLDSRRFRHGFGRHDNLDILSSRLDGRARYKKHDKAGFIAFSQKKSEI